MCFGTPIGWQKLIYLDWSLRTSFERGPISFKFQKIRNNFNQLSSHHTFPHNLITISIISTNTLKGNKADDFFEPDHWLRFAWTPVFRCQREPILEDILQTLSSSTLSGHLQWLDTLWKHLRLKENIYFQSFRTVHKWRHVIWWTFCDDIYLNHLCTNKYE